MCIDYTALNASIIINIYFIPGIDDILDHLGGSVVFSKTDLAQGSNQVGQQRGYECKTAFQTCFGLFEYCVLPFRLYKMPETFNMLMYKII